MAVEEPRQVDANVSADMSVSPDKHTLVPGAPARTVRATRSERIAFFRAASPALAYLSTFLILAGFGVLAIIGGKVAGITTVPLQMPYLVSGTLTGLGLLVAGSALLVISANRRDAAERDQQIEQLGAIMAEVNAALKNLKPEP